MSENASAAPAAPTPTAPTPAQAAPAAAPEVAKPAEATPAPSSEPPREPTKAEREAKGKAALDAVFAKYEHLFEDGKAPKPEAKPQPARAPDGKFQAQAKPAAMGHNQPPEPTAVEPPKEAAPVEKPVEPTKPPAVPEPLQKEFAQRSAEQRQTISRLGNEAKQVRDALSRFEPFVQVLDKHEQTLRADRIDDPIKFVDSMMGWHAALRRDPAAALPALAKAYGYEMPQQASQADDYGLPPDPKVAALEKRNAQLEERLHRIEGGLTSHEAYLRERAAAEQGAQRQSAVDYVTSWFAKNSVPEDIAADVAHHYGVLAQTRPDMAPDQMLQAAFESARWSNPASREKLRKAELEAERKALAEAQATHARQAQQATAVNVRSAPAPNGKQPLDTAYRDVFAKYGHLGFTH
jgi:hypothetical protein